MQTSIRTIDCAGKRFRYAEFEFSYQSNPDDRRLLDDLLKEGERLANHVNPTLARDASKKREYQTILRNCVAGVVAEYCWRYWLRTQSQASNKRISVESKIFQSFDRHVDISVAYPDGSTRTIEVRSSFPYTGLQNAICRVFDIIGWYVNPVKTKEIRKDYYVRTLYPFRSEELWNKLKANSFSAFLCGGATRNLLEQSPFSKDKKFIPFDDIDAMLSSESGIYRVVEPIINAYDTLEIANRILGGAQ